MLYHTKSFVKSGFNPATTDDRQAELEKIKLNHGFDKIFFANQIHSGKVLKYAIDSIGADGDAIICREKNVLLGIFTADCVPITIYSNKIVGLIHAGWRGFVNGIFENFINELMENEKDKLNVIVGPSICKNCYEVGADVAKHFHNIEELKENKFLVDLKQESIDIIKKSALKTDSVQVSSLCTYCSIENLSSYRKNKTNLRQINFVGLK